MRTCAAMRWPGRLCLSVSLRSAPKQARIATSCFPETLMWLCRGWCAGKFSLSHLKVALPPSPSHTTLIQGTWAVRETPLKPGPVRSARLAHPHACQAYVKLEAKRGTPLFDPCSRRGLALRGSDCDQSRPKGGLPRTLHTHTRHALTRTPPAACCLPD